MVNKIVIHFGKRSHIMPNEIVYHEFLAEKMYIVGDSVFVYDYFGILSNVNN